MSPKGMSQVSGQVDPSLTVHGVGTAKIPPWCSTLGCKLSSVHLWIHDLTFVACVSASSYTQPELSLAIFAGVNGSSPSFHGNICLLTRCCSDVFILNGICRSVASFLFVLFFCPQIFTEDTPEIETLPRAKVLDYLEKINPRLAIPYLVRHFLSLCTCVELTPLPPPPPNCWATIVCNLSWLLVGGQCGFGQLISVSIPPCFSLIFTGSHSDGLWHTKWVSQLPDLVAVNPSCYTISNSSLQE